MILHPKEQGILMSTQPQLYACRQDENGTFGVIQDPRGHFVEYVKYQELEEEFKIYRGKVQLIPVELRDAYESIKQLKNIVVSLREVIRLLNRVGLEDDYE